MTGLADLQADFRAAAEQLDAEPGDGLTLLARLSMHRVVGHRRWLDGALELAEACEQPDETWLEAGCRGWVARAAEPFRALIDRGCAAVADEPRAVAALLLAWRVTGRPELRQRALAAAERDGTELEQPLAAWAAFRATAEPHWAEQARASFEGLPWERVPTWRWPERADALDLGGTGGGVATDPPSEAIEVDRLPTDRPASRVVGLPALCLPPLRITVAWWLPEELREGPMAEAATAPYPALRLRFERLPFRDQIRFSATLGGTDRGTLEDAGIVGPWIDSLVEDVDRGPLVGGRRRRRRGSLL